MKKLQEGLKDAGFDVIDETVRSLWNPEEEDFAKIPDLVTSLIGTAENQDENPAETENQKGAKPMKKYQCEPYSDRKSVV